MAPIALPSVAEAAAGLRALDELADVRTSARDGYSVTCDREAAEEENDSPCPLFDTYYGVFRAEGISRLINFTPRQFHMLWIDVAPHINSVWNVGRGKKCSFSGKDVLFMTLVTMKHGGTWDLLGGAFKIKGPTFEKMITGYIKKLSPFLYRKLVDSNADHLSISCGTQFVHFPSALYATDVTFQHANRPSGNTAEGKIYYT